ncbi:MAG: hypothetical protein J6K33_03910 [Alistipes sp.]|nr:hypothetical protein [Alistipes sp.]
MKKIFYLASIAALAFSSCTKDETTSAVIDSVRGGSKIMAKAEGDATRTHLEAVNGNYEFRWSENDVIGVYGNGANSAKNVPFTLLDSYSDQAEGVFESNYQLLNGDNFFAYYPQVPGNEVVPQWVKATATTAGYWKLDSFKMKIAKDQNYKPGSFNTVTAPAVSTNFMVDEDGNADVTMQPVGDYLFVDLTGTEDIQTVTLELLESPIVGTETTIIPGYWMYKSSEKPSVDLTNGLHKEQILVGYNGWFPVYEEGWVYDGDVHPTVGDESKWEWVKPVTITKDVYGDGRPVAIAGEGTLKEYTYVDANKNASTRYYLSNQGMDKYEITLTTGQLTDIVCHEANTYVFVVPGGILGTNPEAEGVGKDPIVAKVTVNKGTDLEQVFEFDGASINGGVNNMGTPSTADDVKAWRQKTVKDGEMIVTGIKWENTVFWANTANKGVRMAEMYNPEGDFIIRNEVDFLQYMNEYDGDEVGNAYVCADYNFNFSDENMRALAAQITKTQNSANANLLRRYIDDYVANGVPCVAEYTSKFKGNGATFHALKKLQSPAGLFGVIKGSSVIKDITFEGIVAPQDPATKTPVLDADGDEVTNNKGEVQYEYTQGLVLGKAAEKATFSKVGVVNANAHAILSLARVHQYEGLIIENAENLDEIVCNFIMEKDLAIKNWDEVSVVEDVFGLIQAEAGKNNDQHHVVTIAEGGAAEYDKLAGEIKVYRNSAKAVSVVIDEVSYWTGSTVNTAAIPAVKNAYVNTIAYAEQLAYGKGNLGASSIATIPGTYAAMTRDMDANYENIEITWPNEVDYSGVVFSGAEFAVKGIVLNTSVKDNEKVAYENIKPASLAPFKFTYVSDLTLDGVEFNINTSNTDTTATVPAKVAGLSITASEVANVAINDLNINTFEVSSTLNHDAYYGTVVPTIGWLVAEAQNLQIEESSADVAYSSLEGRAGLVGKVTITDTDSFFENCSVSYGNLNDQEAIADFTKFDETKNKNVYGTMVAHVINNDNKAHGIKFYGCGNPVFLYTIGTGAAINVYYDNDTEVLNK